MERALPSAVRAHAKPWRPWLMCAATAALAVSGAALTLSAAKADPAQTEPSVSVPVLTVEAASTKTRQWPQLVTATGNVAPWQEAVVAASVGGLRVSEVLVSVGDSVRKGQPLARFDQATLKSDVTALAADAMQARAAAVRAAAELDRAKELYLSDAISNQGLLQQRTQAETTQAQVAAADARLKTRQIQLEQAVIDAPDDGLISSRSANLGAVEPAGQELFRLIRRGRLQWQGEMSAKQLAVVKAGQVVKIELPDGTQAVGHVSKLDPRISVQSRLGLVYVDIEPGSSARAGMFASAGIELATTSALAVPAAGVFIRDGRSIAAVLIRNRGHFTVSLRTVTTGRLVGGEVEILTGLKEGDEVVARGAQFLSEADVVVVSHARLQPIAKG